MRRKKLCIAQIAPLWIPIPPRTYGGTELVVFNLTEELTRRGHDVTLFASGDSRTRARLIPIGEKAIWLEKGFRSPHAPITVLLKEISNRFHEFDIIHNHFNFFPFPLSLNPACPPLLTTVHRPVDSQYAEAMRAYPKITFCAISKDQKRSMEEQGIPVLKVIPNGIDVSQYDFCDSPSNHLLYLGRLNREKGVLTAIEVAKAAGEKLIVAGNSVGNEEWSFFLHELQPFLNDERISFRGQVNFQEKVELFRNAKALLFPIERREPFGLVMIESMACGTPVIAFRKGSVSEVVEHEKTGFVVDTKEEMIEAIRRISKLDRQSCRKRVEERFTLDKMVNRYEELYQKLL